MTIPQLLSPNGVPDRRSQTRGEKKQRNEELHLRLLPLRCFCIRFVSIYDVLKASADKSEFETEGARGTADCSPRTRRHGDA